jgi:hypothetical protein
MNASFEYAVILDCHTMWFRGYPCVGVPGSDNFHPKRDDDALEGFPHVIPPEAANGGRAKG